MTQKDNDKIKALNNEVKEEDLRECPFCGATSYVEVEKKMVQTINEQYCQAWEARWNVRCTHPFCFVQPKTRDFNSLSDAVEAWNNRP